MVAEYLEDLFPKNAILVELTTAVLTACTVTALLMAGSNGASTQATFAQANTVCAGPSYAYPNPAGDPLTYTSQPAWRFPPTRRRPTRNL